MIQPSSLNPDVELAEALSGQISVGTTPVKVYSDWERPTNGLPADFITVYMNGDIGGVGMDTPYANGYLMVSLYCKMNDDGSVKKNRVKNILKQFDTLLEKKLTDNYHFEYDAERFITPTTPNQSSGYSITTLNLRWTTTSNINK
jgi:hypothetical protein